MKKLTKFLIAIMVTLSLTNADAQSNEAKQNRLSELSKLQTNILADIVQKQTTELEKRLHKDLSLITFQGMKLGKKEFLSFVEGKDVVFESITPSDFQLGYMDNKLTVLTYKESVKISGQPQAIPVIVSIVYKKENDLWMAISIHATMLSK